MPFTQACTVSSASLADAFTSAGTLGELARTSLYVLRAAMANVARWCRDATDEDGDAKAISFQFTAESLLMMASTFSEGVTWETLKFNLMNLVDDAPLSTMAPPAFLFPLPSLASFGALPPFPFVAARLVGLLVGWLVRLCVSVVVQHQQQHAQRMLSTRPR